jgi:orotidine-5'-phosphate decarboxylase
LDLPSEAEALRYVKILAGAVGCFKVGLQLFLAAGPRVIPAIRDRAPEAGIFLDLKLHDIPATVGLAMERIAQMGADLATVHAQAGPEALAAAVAARGEVRVLAVTLLTSLAPASLPELARESQAPGAYVALLAQRALSASCQGLVASPLEAKDLRDLAGPAPLLVIPGARPSWASVAADDQARVGSPARAVRDGATLVVVGRPIRDAPDPREAALAVAAEIPG